MYFMFKNLLHSMSEKILNEGYEKIVEGGFCKKYPQFLRYMQYLWKQKKEWASCYRVGLPLRGNNTSNYVEVAFRILKDSIL